jgi:hypothetical protein
MGELSSVGNFQSPALNSYPEAALQLPPAGETWTRDDIDVPRGALKRFSQAGVIEKAGRDDHNRYRWRTVVGVVEWVEDHIAGRSYTPCGCSTGIRTLEAGETYSCTNDDCDETFGRETAMEVMN